MQSVDGDRAFEIVVSLEAWPRPTPEEAEAAAAKLSELGWTLCGEDWL